MNRPTGRWQLEIRTPLGKQTPVVEITGAADDLTGTAAANGEAPVELRNLAWEEPNLSWDQSVTHPLRLELHFEIVVDGDELQGHARAGRLPRSTVTGRRLNARA